MERDAIANRRVLVIIHYEQVLNLPGLLLLLRHTLLSLVSTFAFIGDGEDIHT